MQLKIWRITYEGEALAAQDRERVRAQADQGAPMATIVPAGFDADRPRGQRLYEADCAACHGRDGRGVENFAPALVGSRRLSADPQRLAREMLEGYPPSDDWYNVMPAYADGPYDDGALAAILTYARDRFVDEGPVEEADVAEARARLER
jgi:mono/diheme cytochrome c family protein